MSARLLASPSPRFADPVPTSAESLNALYIYEAQMSFLIRLASSREGAEKLMDAELLSRLAECDYLGARPLDETSAMGASSAFPSHLEYATDLSCSLNRLRRLHSSCD